MGQAPRGIYLLVLALAAAGTVGVLFPIAGAALVVAILLSIWIAKTLRDPITGIIGAFGFYQICAFLRSTYGAYHLPVWAGGVRLFPDFALVVTFGGLIIRASKNRERFRVYPDDLPVLVFLVSGVYGFVLAASYLPPYGPMNGWWVSMTPAVFYFAMRFMRPTAAEADRLMRFFLISFAVLAIGSFYQYILRPEWLIKISQAERPYFATITNLAPDVYWRLYMRMESLLFEENVWGTLCAFVALYSLTGIRGRQTPWKTTAVLALSLAGMGFSMSRGAVLTWCIGVCVLLLLRGRHRGRIITALIAIAIVGGVVMSRWGSASNINMWLDRVNTLTSTDAKHNASSDRVHQWRAGWDIFVHNPSGTGLGTAGYAAHLSGIGSHVVADGIYFRILAELGIPGAVMTLYALIGVAWVLFRHVFDYSCSPKTRRLGMTLLAFHCGFVIQSIGANTYDLWYIPSIFWTFFGVFMTLCDRDQRASIAACKAGAARTGTATALRGR